MKTPALCFLLLLITAWNLAAQEIIFSKAFRAQDHATCQVLGKMGKSYVVLEQGVAPYGKNILRVFDEQMQQVGDKKKVKLPLGGGNLHFLLYDSSLVKTYTQKLGGKVFLMAVVIDGFTQVEGTPTILDSMSAEVAALSGTWSIGSSVDKSKLLINSVKYNYDSASISTKIFNPRLQKLQFSDFKIFLLAGQEAIGKFLVSNQGDIYFPILPVKGGMNKFEMLSKPFKEKYYRSLLIDLKNKYINKGALTFTIDEAKGNGTLLINATYFNNINSTVDEGFFSARINAETNQSKAVFNPLKDSLFSINNISNSSNSFAQITLNKVFILNNGGLMLVGEINRSRTMLVGNSRNYLNQTIIDPRLVYNPGNADQRLFAQQPMYIEPASYAPRRQVELYNKDIVVCYLDSSLRLQRKTVIEKDQQDIKTELPLYLSIAAINTSGGVHLLYRELQRGGGILRNNRFSPAGEMVRLPPLKTFYSTYKLIPAYARQVGLRQVIVPGVYRGKTVFAKIDL